MCHWSFGDRNTCIHRQEQGGTLLKYNFRKHPSVQFSASKRNKAIRTLAEILASRKSTWNSLLISLGPRFYFQILSVFYFIIGNVAVFDIFSMSQSHRSRWEDWWPWFHSISPVQVWAEKTDVVMTEEKGVVRVSPLPISLWIVNVVASRVSIRDLSSYVVQVRRPEVCWMQRCVSTHILLYTHAVSWHSFQEKS